MNINSFIDQPTSQRQQTVYLRSYQRNIPSQPLQPYLDARPVLTKYSILPIVDPRKQITTPLIQQSTFTPETVYNPGNDAGPWSGYASNINHETELRNQIFALQSCSQAAYIPSSKSSLYQVKWKNNNNTWRFFLNLKLLNPAESKKVLIQIFFLKNAKCCPLLVQVEYESTFIFCETFPLKACANMLRIGC